jgi:hypothetical protein
MKIFFEELKNYLADLNEFLAGLRKKLDISAEYIYRLFLRSFFIIISMAFAIGLICSLGFIIYKLFGLKIVYIFIFSIVAVGLIYILGYQLSKPSKPQQHYTPTANRPQQYYAPTTVFPGDNSAEQLKIQKDILKAQKRIAANTAQTAFYNWQRNNENWQRNNSD